MYGKKGMKDKKGNGSMKEMPKNGSKMAQKKRKTKKGM